MERGGEGETRVVGEFVPAQRPKTWSLMARFSVQMVRMAMVMLV